MLLLKICRNCKRFNIIKNDNTGRDKKLVEEYIKKDLICNCKK